MMIKIALKTMSRMAFRMLKTFQTMPPVGQEGKLEKWRTYPRISNVNGMMESRMSKIFPTMSQGGPEDVLVMWRDLETTSTASVITSMTPMIKAAMMPGTGTIIENA